MGNLIRGRGSQYAKTAFSPLRQERGQVAILFALVFTFMFILFAFVVDFAHLVNSKINLQIAADSAAYAGAAQQARVLNRLAIINYRMRQNLKEMAMRSNVTHLRHNLGFPRGQNFLQASLNQTSNVEQFICQQAHGYRALSGLIYDNNTNLCKNASPSGPGIPPIVVPPVIARFDPFAIAIQAQIRRIQQAADQECAAAANDNRVLAEYLINAYTSRSQFYIQQANALVQYLNSMAQERTGEGSQNAIIRTAYQSARRNLTLSNNNDSFQLDILTPEGGQVIDIVPRNLSASLFYINFRAQGGSCVGLPGVIDFNNMVAGFSKAPEVLTWFGVRARTRPNLFFMPTKWVEGAFPEMTAYATAKPFGSRIGPQINADILAPIANRPGSANRNINFSVRPNDQVGMRSVKLQALYDALHPFNGIGNPEGRRERGWPVPRPGGPSPAAIAAVRAPTLFDATFFTIFPDVGPNASTDYLQPQFAQALYPEFMRSFDAQGNAINIPQARVPAYFNGPGIAGGEVQAFANGVDGPGPYSGYAAEGNNAHSVTSVDAIGINAIAGNPTEFGFATPEIIHSGWAPNGEPGRIGYSVKFVGMNGLVRAIEVDDRDGNRTRIVNPPVGDPDLQRVIH